MNVYIFLLWKLSVTPQAMKANPLFRTVTSPTTQSMDFMPRYRQTDEAKLLCCRKQTAALNIQQITVYKENCLSKLTYMVTHFRTHWLTLADIWEQSPFFLHLPQPGLDIRLTKTWCLTIDDVAYLYRAIKEIENTRVHTCTVSLCRIFQRWSHVFLSPTLARCLQTRWSWALTEEQRWKTFNPKTRNLWFLLSAVCYWNKSCKSTIHIHACCIIVYYLSTYVR